MNKPLSPRQTYYDDARGMEMLKTLAARRGLSRVALLRSLLREEYRREGLAEPEVKTDGEV